jgi:hypothetical protein
MRKRKETDRKDPAKGITEKERRKWGEAIWWSYKVPKMTTDKFCEWGNKEWRKIRERRNLIADRKK